MYNKNTPAGEGWGFVVVRFGRCCAVAGWRAGVAYDEAFALRQDVAAASGIVRAMRTASPVTVIALMSLERRRITSDRLSVAMVAMSAAATAGVMLGSSVPTSGPGTSGGSSTMSMVPSAGTRRRRDGVRSPRLNGESRASACTVVLLEQVGRVSSFGERRETAEVSIKKYNTQGTGVP